MIRSIAMVLLCGMTWPCLAADTATLLKDDVLRGKPFLDGPTVVALKRGSVVQVQKRQGTWTSVRSGQKSGWVRSLSLRSAASGTPPKVAAVDTGRLGTGRIVSTTGVRGLTNEPDAELKQAQFNAEALASADRLAVDAEAARAFATAGKLKARSVDWLPEVGQ